MSRQDDLIRQACARLAQEETEALERSLTQADREAADALFRRHRRSALALIGRTAGKQRSRVYGALRVAAAAVLVLGAAYWGLSRHPQDPTTPPPGPGASVSPYFTQAPTDSPIFTEVPTESPTQTPVPTVYQTILPTLTPLPTLSPTPSPAVRPREASALPLPGGWAGQYFPSALPDGYTLDETEQGEGYHTAIYQSDSQRIVFSEYDASRLIHAPGGARMAYVPLANGALALRMETEEGVTLSWDLDGRSFSLFASDGRAEEIAQNVKKISER